MIIPGISICALALCGAPVTAAAPNAALTIHLKDFIVGPEI
jgi:hypothetical protein